MRNCRLHQFVIGALAVVLAACNSSSNSPGDAGGQATGRVCELGPLDGASDAGAVAIVNGVALECPSRTCLLAPMENGSTARPLCTSPCTSNADCAGGQLGDANDPNDLHCKTGFTCMVPFTVGDFACQKLCVCVDSLNVPAGGFETPPICADAGSG